MQIHIPKAVIIKPVFSHVQHFEMFYKAFLLQKKSIMNL